VRTGHADGAGASSSTGQEAAMFAATDEPEAVKDLKRVSNLWLNERGRDYAGFEWQGG